MLKRYAMFLCCGAVTCTLLGVVHGEDLHITIPDASSLRLPSHDPQTGLISFVGQIRLHGHLLLRSYRKEIDGEFENRVSLLFQASTQERNKLPQVRYTTETLDPPWIELDFFQQEKITNTIETIFGSDIAAKAGKDSFDLIKQGYLTLEAFQTNVECDHRYYYAELVSFESQEDLTAEQVEKTVREMSGSCF